MTISEDKSASDELQDIELQDIEQLEQERKQSYSSDWASGIDVVEIAKGAVDIIGDLIGAVDLSI